jgi:glucose-6-phosphate dehydrogenase assembly protein OpcA
MTTLGEPISGGQAPRGGDDLTLRFDKTIDLQRVRDLLQQARERVGITGDSVCTLNLVAFYYSAAAYERARRALEAAGRIHPCRLIVIITEQADTDSVIARVSVVRRSGGISVERIVLTATGRGGQLLQSTLRAESALRGLLLPELPVVATWGGRAEGEVLRRVVEAADRVIIDSDTRAPEQLVQIAAYLERGAPIGDLAWARIFPWMSMAAEILDVPDLREHRGNLASAKVTCAGGIGAEGVLLAGWFASRVRRAQVELAVGAEPEVDSPTPGAGDGAAHAALPAPAPLSKGQVAGFLFTAPPATFLLRREKGILVAEVRGDDDGEVIHRVRLPPEEPGRLLGLELKLLSGVDELYAAAVEAGAKLLAKK